MSPTFPRRGGRAVVAALVALTIALLGRAGPDLAAAQVEPVAGHEATVAGWTSWYGAYGLGDLGIGWCIDHGLRAPDPDLGYEPTPVDEQAATTRAAVAWAVGAYGHDPDADRAAAVMLAVHDLMGAVYPIGTLDVDALDPAQLAGFDGHEAEVLAAAQAIKADALAHAHLEGTIWLAVDASPVPAGATGELVVRMTDSVGQPVVGVGVTVRSEGAWLTAGSTTTGADGRARVPFTAAEGWNGFSADATAPDPTLHAFASIAAPTQRVAVPASVPRHAEAGFVVAPPPPPTTTTTTTTTTVPVPTSTTTTSTTTSTSTTTTTTVPAATSTVPTTTSVPETTTTVETAAPTTTSTTTIPTTVWTETRGPLPRTGADSRALAALGATTTVLGALLVHAARRRVVRPR